MTERQHIFKTLDNPMRILFWSLDEFLMMAIPMLIGMFVGDIFIMLFCLALAMVLKNRYIKLQKTFPNGSLKHLIYWYLHPIGLRKVGKIQSLPLSHYRELLL